MAKQKTSRVSLGDPGDGAPAPDNRSPMERAAEKEETAILELLNSEQVNDATIELKRRGVAQTVFAHLAEIPAKGFSQENVKRIFGGGDYKARVRFAKSGNFGPQFDFTIDHSIPSIYPMPAKAADPSREDRTPELVNALSAAFKSALPAVPAGPDALTLQLIKSQGEMLQALLLRAPVQPATDPALLDLLKETRAELRALREAPRGGDSFMAEIKKFQTLSELFGSNGADNPPAPVDFKMKLVEVLGPAFAPLIANMLTNGAAGAAVAAQPALMPAAAANPNPAADPNQPATDMNPLFKVFLAQFRSLALVAAAKGRNAYEWADSKLDDIGAQYHPQIFALANKDDWFAQIFGADPGASAHRDWLFAMRNAILTRAFVGHVRANAAAVPRPDPAALAAQFVDSVSESYLDTLSELVGTPAMWERLWVSADPATAPIDAAWLEQVRVAFEDELFEDDTPTAAEPVTSPAASTPPASQPDAPAPAPKPARPAAPRKPAKSKR